jgi:hypothetical protein
MIIKILKKIAGVLFAISKDLKAIRKALEKKSESNTSHEWIEDYIDERLAAKSREVERIKAIRKTLEKQEINHS